MSRIPSGMRRFGVEFRFASTHLSSTIYICTRYPYYPLLLLLLRTKTKTKTKTMMMNTKTMTSFRTIVTRRLTSSWGSSSSSSSSSRSRAFHFRVAPPSIAIGACHLSPMATAPTASSFQARWMTTVDAGALQLVEDDDNEDSDAAGVAVSFQDLPSLHPDSKRAVTQKLGLTTMTEIQSKTFGAAASGRDVLGRARTGTGKTLAFLLPAIETLLRDETQNDSTGKGIGILVLSPTRELAQQIYEQARVLTSCHDSMTTQVVYGGTAKVRDEAAFGKRIPSILVATPGRLIDHLETTDVRGIPFAKLVQNTRVLVLDETDRLLDMGFRSDIERILSYLGSVKKTQRQTLLFSATLPADVRSVMAASMRPDYLTVDCVGEHDPASHTNAQVSQTVVTYPNSMQIDAPIRILAHLMESNPNSKVVAFFPTANQTRFYSSLFRKLFSDKPIIEIHSRKSQSVRTKASDRFRKSRGGVALFTSDVSARGVDYPGVTHVVQMGIPDSRETYIHRLGRTGRAGREGQGILVLTETEQPFVRNVLRGMELTESSELDEVARGGGPFGEKVESVLEHMRLIVKEETDEELQSDVAGAYRSMLGYYKGHLKALGLRDVGQLVKMVNDFSDQSGRSQPPSISAMVARNMGMMNVPGLNIQEGGRDGSSGRGGRGGGSDRRSSDSGGHRGGSHSGGHRGGGHSGGHRGGGHRGGSSRLDRSSDRGRGWR